MKRPDTGTALLLVALAAFLGVSLWLAIRSWVAIDTEIGFQGYLALVLGVIGSLGLGIGLMMLVFYSARHRYDQGQHDHLDQR